MTFGLVDEYKKRISAIEEKIKSVQSSSSHEVCLMAVSKTRTLDEINAAYEAGVRLFGENHVQEIVEKFSSNGKTKAIR